MNPITPLMRRFTETMQATDQFLASLGYIEGGEQTSSFGYVSDEK